MSKRSAGLLVYRHVGDGIEVLVVHPGGPFWARKDEGAWSIPKGEVEERAAVGAAGHGGGGQWDAGERGEGETGEGETEIHYATAKREFAEELGQPPPDGDPIDLGDVKQAGGKLVRAFALLSESDHVDPDAIVSNTFDLEWPRGSGRMLTIPEVDRAEWMTPDTARKKLVPAQATLVDRLLEMLEP